MPEQASPEAMRPAAASAPRHRWLAFSKRRSAGLADSPLHRLLALQSAEGWFNTGPAVDEAIASNSALRSARESISKRLDIESSPNLVKERHNVEQTLFVLHILREGYAAESAVWQAARGKAERYLAVAMHKSVQEIQVWIAEMLRGLTGAAQSAR
jgi:hypothetical protein